MRLRTLLAVLSAFLMTGVILSFSAAAQDYRFPTSSADYSYFYPTSYYYHSASGKDWNCGTMTYSGHKGNDFGAGGFAGMDAGRDITAAAAGTVYYVHDGEFDRCTSGSCAGGGGFGNHVIIQHADGKRTLYGHMKQWSILVSQSQTVTCGQKIGEMGSSGYSTGPHIHFEVRDDDYSYGAYDPFYGSCGIAPSWWVNQGAYNGKPTLDCDGGGPCYGPMVTLTVGGSAYSDDICQGYYQQYQFPMSSGVAYRVTVTPSSGDPDLYLHSASNVSNVNYTYLSTNSGTSVDLIDFVAPSNGTYYAAVYGYASGTSAYTIKVEATARPNLAPYTPSGWSDKIVTSKVTGTSTDDALMTSDTVYVDWAVINNGSAATGARFYAALYLDGTLKSSWYVDPPLNANSYTYATDYSLGSLTAGSHTLRIVADSTGTISESNESDNEYTKTFSVGQVQLPNLTPYQPSGWSGKIVTSKVTGTNTDDTLTTSDTVYVDWAVINNGSAATGARFYAALYLDGTLKTSWYTDPPLNVNAYAYVLDYSLGTLAAGSHTLRIVADSTGTISESNESDNEYTKTFSVTAAAATISRAPSSLTPSCVEGQDAPSETFDVWNSGSGTLSYSISDDATWLSVSPASGTSTGGHDTITVTYATSGLSAQGQSQEKSSSNALSMAVVAENPTELPLTWTNNGGPSTVGDQLTDEQLSMIEIMFMDSPPHPRVGYDRPIVIDFPKSSRTLQVPTSTWTYGCSATSAGMLFGFYDRNGYPNMYTGPANGGVAPMTDLGQGISTPITGACSIIATQNGFDGRTTRGHVDDYWVSYLSGGPDPWWVGHWTEHTWSSCTADYMGTNQWKWDYNSNGASDSNVDGATTFFFNNNASPLYDYIPPASYGLPQTELCHGMRLFAESQGYTVTANYTQKIDAQYAGGFSFAQFKQEIDAGRPVLIQVVGHTMVGVGYDDAVANTVYLNDTWDNSVHQMTWGGSYSGMQHVAVTVLQLAPAAGTYNATITITAPGATNTPQTVPVTLTVSPPTTYTISGTVTVGGVGLAGVAISGLPGSPVTNGSGVYTATVNSGFSGTATPTLAGYTFVPASRTYTNVTSNQTAQDYAAQVITYTISGVVTLNGSGLAGVVMNGLPGSPSTGSDGSYSATVAYGWSGTMTPAKTGCTFTPANRTYSNVTSNQSSQNYSAQTPGTVVVAINPPTTNTYVGQTFCVEVQVIAGTQQVDGAGAYLHYDTAKLAYQSTTAGTSLPLVLSNTHGDGTVDFVAGTVSSFPSGTFTLCTVCFTALAEAADPGTCIAFDTIPPRQTDVTFGGYSVFDHTEDGCVVISSSGELHGAVTLEGRPAKPHARWIVDLDVVLSPVDPSGSCSEVQVSTDDSGSFTVEGIDPGEYEVWVKGSHTLAASKSVTINSGVNSEDFGVLREGDANNDNKVTLLDFSVLATTFAKCTGQPGFDARADFNQDGCVTLLDFSLLASHFGQGGPAVPCTTAKAALAEFSAGIAKAMAEEYTDSLNGIVEDPTEENRVLIAIGPDEVKTKVGEIFDVVVEIQTGDQPIDGAAACLTFDPAVLQVECVSTGSELPIPLLESFDNDTGEVTIAAGALSSFPSGEIGPALVTFRVVGASGGTVIDLTNYGECETQVTFEGVALPSLITNGMVMVEADGL